MTKVKITRGLRQFTGCRKQSCYIHVKPAGNTVDTPSYWDGGSRDDWAVKCVVNGKTAHVPTNHPFFNAGAMSSVTLEHGMILLRTGVFCGKTATPAVYLTLPTLLTVAAEWGVDDLATELARQLGEDELVAADAALQAIQR